MQQSKQRLDTHNKGMPTKAPSLVGFTPTHEHQIHLPWSWAQTKHLDNTHVVWLWCVNSVLFLLHVKSALELSLFIQGTFKIQIGGVPNHIELCLTQWLAAQQSHYYTQLKIIKYMGKNVLNAKNVNIHRSIQAVTHSNAVEAGSNSYADTVQMPNVQKYILQGIYKCPGSHNAIFSIRNLHIMVLSNMLWSQLRTPTLDEGSLYNYIRHSKILTSS